MPIGGKMNGYYHVGKTYSNSDFKPKQDQPESKPKSRGLGDAVEAILTKTGIKSLFHKIVPEKSCGCKKRKEMLNKLVPFSNNNENI